MLLRRSSSITSRIATVDVSPLRDATASHAARLAAANALSSCFARDGFAVVVGHGVASSTMEGLRGEARAFFGQPIELKAAYDTGKGYGYGGYVREGRENGAQLLGDFSRPADLVESLTLRGLTLPAWTTAAVEDAANEAVEGVESSPRMGFGGIHKGSESAPASLVEPARRFVAESRVLSAALAEVAHLALGVPSAELDALVDVGAAGCRLAHYPPQRTDAAPGQLRYGAHVDSGGITVLSLDPSNHAGLQVDLSHLGPQAEEAQRDWADVPLVDNGLVCNCGALLSRWTHGRWRASVHRVLNGDTTRARLSVVTNALTPRPDAPAVAGFTSCLPAGATAEPVVVQDFLTRRVALHRQEYAQEMALRTPAELESERERIRSLDV